MFIVATVSMLSTCSLLCQLGHLPALPTTVYCILYKELLRSEKAGPAL